MLELASIYVMTQSISIETNIYRVFIVTREYDGEGDIYRREKFFFTPEF